MQMIIVDDEAHWVENLSSNKPWQSLGISRVHKAYSAREALRIMETEPIDIVISDIIMPEMTGIELIEQIRQRDKRIKCIILSGHADFEYSKQAIQHQAAAYLLKPPSDGELLEAVEAVAQQVKAEWENRFSNERIRSMLRENLPLLRGRLLLDALSGKKLPEAEWSRKLDHYGLSLHYGVESALLLIRMEEEFERHGSGGLQLMEYAVVNMAEEILGEYVEVWAVKDDHGYLVFLLQPKAGANMDGKETLLERLSIQLQDKVKQYLQGSLSAVVTEWFAFPVQLYARYRQAAAYFRQIVGDEREFVMRVGESEPAGLDGPLEALYIPPSLGSLLETGRWDVARDRLMAVFEELEQRTLCSWEHCMESGFYIASRFTHLAHRNGHSLGALIGTDLEPLENGDAFRSIGKLRKWSLRVLDKLQEQTSNEIKSIRDGYVTSIRAFAERNLHGDVSLRALADHVNLHPTHLSKIYKIETGEGISDFISRLRMERACNLLRTTDKKVYEISMEVGYLDPAYFIKVFKRQFGVTPQEYRGGN